MMDYRRGSDLLTVNELARHLGISKWTVYRLVRSGKIRAVRVGERIRFRPGDVDAYLEREAPGPPVTLVEETTS